ncbi:MAG: XRE family transcriptional regulator [Bacteroidetes bacterium]|nr:XRE family transcriptional regulator [Bacteroidota bacterium]MCL2303477.1 XRE family transcriptional regulator [Lentimicrobiaceae bacterium]
MNEKHTGKLIQRKMEEEGRKANWLAKKLHCHRNNIYRIYQQEHIHPELLHRISIALKHNFFAHYYDYANEQITV